MPRESDPELIDLRVQLGADEYKRLYTNYYQRTMQHGDKRYSGKHYKNTPERISALREKYKNGVPDGTIEKMLGLKNGETAEKR